MIGGIIVLGIFIFLVYWLITLCDTKNYKVNTKLENGLELIEHGSKVDVTNYSLQCVTGKIRNNTDCACSVALTIQIFDKQNNTIGNLNDFIQILNPGQIWSFKTSSHKPFRLYTIYIEKM